MLDKYCEWEFGKPDFITHVEITWLTAITAATGIWTMLNVVMVVFIFCRYMVPLRIYGTLILQFYILALLQ